MRRATRISVALSAAVLALGAAAAVQAQQARDMTFFVTSAGRATARTSAAWTAPMRIATRSPRRRARSRPDLARLPEHAQPGGEAAVNARDRIGKGPWRNAKGVVVAKNVEDLHSANNNITKQTALTEKGESSRAAATRRTRTTSSPARDPQGTYFDGGRRHDLRQLDEERRRLGDRRPPRPHGSQGHAPHEVVELLARLARLQPGRAASTGGAGLFYCFAAN